MSTVQTDRLTFNTLTLAQGAINAVQRALPYGANNQLEDLKVTRAGEDPRGQTGPRVDAVRKGVAILLQQSHAPLPHYFANNGALYRNALFSGAALYYGAGNCGEHASLAFNYLTLFGFPGIEIQYVNSDFNAHSFCLLTWDGCKDPVVCDAWASRPQACLYSHYFANPKFFPQYKGPLPEYEIDARYCITEKNMGHDIMKDAFQALKPGAAGTLPLQSTIKGLSKEEALEMIEHHKKYGIFHLIYTLAPEYPQIEYEYEGKILHEVSPMGEPWTASILPIIAEVDNELRILDPELRYVGKRG